MVGTTAGPLTGADIFTEDGSGAALQWAVVGGLRPRCESEGLVLCGLGDLSRASLGSGEGTGGVGEGEALSDVIEASGGKHRRARCSST